MNFIKERSEKDKVIPSASDKDSIKSILGEGMTLVGDLSFKGKVRIDCHIQGNVKGECLILSESGKVTGDIEADSCICHGKVEGNVRAKKLFIKKTATIQGRVDTAEFSVDAGASLKGEIISRCQDLRVLEGSSLQKNDQQTKIKDQLAKKVSQMTN